MEELENRVTILEHKMDSADIRYRELQEEQIRTRLELNESLHRLDQRMDQLSARLEQRIDELNVRFEQRTGELNSRIDQMSNSIHQLGYNLTNQILNASAEMRRTNRWIVTVAIAIITILPITMRLAERWL